MIGRQMEDNSQNNTIQNQLQKVQARILDYSTSKHQYCVYSTLIWLNIVKQMEMEMAIIASFEDIVTKCAQKEILNWKTSEFLKGVHVSTSHLLLKEVQNIKF